MPDQVPVTAASVGVQHQQLPQFFLDDPGSRDLAGRVGFQASVPHPDERRRPKSFVRRQQAPPVDPLAVDGPSAASTRVLADPSADVGDHRVGDLDQVEVVDDQGRVGQRRADRRGIRGGRVDRDMGHRGSKRRGADIQPCGHVRRLTPRH